MFVRVSIYFAVVVAVVLFLMALVALILGAWDFRLFVKRVLTILVWPLAALNSRGRNILFNLWRKL